MGIYKEMEQKGWLNNSDTYRAKDSGVYGRMYQLINQYNPVTGQFGLANTPEARNAYLREAEMRNTGSIPYFPTTLHKTIRSASLPELKSLHSMLH